MDSSKINEWLQVAGTFGVIISLVFVGLQLRQSHEIALSTTYQDRAQMLVDINSASLGSPELMSATAKLYSGEFEELTPLERVALEYDWASQMAGFENLHYQFELGYLPAEHWDQKLDDLHCYFSLSLYRELWEEYGYRQSFESVVNEMIDDAKQNPSCFRSSKPAPVD